VSWRAERGHLGLCSGSLRIARDDKLKCKKEYRELASGRTFGAFRCGVGAMRLEETLITIPLDAKHRPQSEATSYLSVDRRQPTADKTGK